MFLPGLGLVAAGASHADDHAGVGAVGCCSMAAATGWASKKAIAARGSANTGCATARTPARATVERARRSMWILPCGNQTSNRRKQLRQTGAPPLQNASYVRVQPSLPLAVISGDDRCV